MIDFFQTFIEFFWDIWIFGPASIRQIIIFFFIFVIISLIAIYISNKKLTENFNSEQIYQDINGFEYNSLPPKLQNSRRNLVFTSCGDDPFSKVKTENVEQAAVRDNTPSKFPVMTFDKKVHDFGTIMDGEAQETVFSYTNTGEAPLVITEIKSTCGCTVPQDWSRAPLLPGESSQFTVKFNGKGMNKTSKTVTIKANTQRGTESVRISAFINKPGGVAPPAGPIIQ